MSDIIEYHQKLLEATSSDTEVCTSICRHPSRADRCAEEQLRILNTWITAEDLTIHPEKNQRASQNRSPLKYFTTTPSTESLSKIHEDNIKCGISSLVAIIEQDGERKLRHWVAQTGAGSHPATLTHNQLHDGAEKEASKRIVSLKAIIARASTYGSQRCFFFSVLLCLVSIIRSSSYYGGTNLQFLPGKQPVAMMFHAPGLSYNPRNLAASLHARRRRNE